ncbi:MAG TPA: hypothetical protein VG649_12635 [Candidatus Angelobacter sp.]|jgi:hypothetical protein|nr:hypothetical protein [Candidatus Angelobacter sp.]
MKTKPNGLEKHGVSEERPLRSVAKRQYQPAEQIDFGTGFHTDSHAPIRYETRYGPNRQHDVFYLSSYIHDATFRIDELDLRRKSLFLPLNRDRWELYRGVGDLVSIRSELTISRVVSLRLELGHSSLLRKKFLRAPKVTIFHLHTVSEQWEGSDDEEIIIDFSYHARLRLRVGLEFRITLRDLATRQSS